MEDPPASSVVVVEKRHPFLTDRERTAYEFLMAHPQPHLSPGTQLKLFTLFLQGVDCAEIARLNQGITLAQVVVARVEGHWDDLRQEHIESLLKEARLRLQQTALESADFVTMQIAAAHKQYGDAVKKYMQTGDTADLGGFSIHGWKSYREAQDLLKVITGTDKTQVQKVQGEVKHTHVNETITVPAVNRAMTPEEARAAVKQLLFNSGK